MDAAILTASSGELCQEEPYKTQENKCYDFQAGLDQLRGPAHLKQGSNSQLLTMTTKQMLQI